MTLRACGPWLIVLALVALGGWTLLPPQPVPAPSGDRFSAEAAFAHVEVIARTPHPMGTPAIAQVRAYLVDRLEHLGIEVTLQSTTVPNYYGGGEPVSVVNVIGGIPGTASTGAIVLMGHYDTVPATAGANDNSAAVATLLETARALRAGSDLRNDVVLLFTDGEEPAPRYGATAFLADRRAVGDIGLVVNLEASGGSGPSFLAETSGPEAWLVAELAAADARPAAYSFFTELARSMGDIGTDFDGFRRAEIPGLHFVYLHDSPIYHTPADDLASVSLGSLQHHGTHALGIARHFGNLDLSRPPEARGAVYFVIRPFFVRYPTAWVVPLALLTLILFGLAVVRRRGRGVGGPSLLGSSAVAFLGVGLGTIVGLLVWSLVISVRASPGVAEAFGILLVLVAGGAWAVGRIPVVRRRSGVEGIALVWILLSLLTAFTLPGFSYLFLWPALGATAALWMRDEASGLPGVMRLAVVAAPALLLTIPAIDVFFQFAQPRPGNLESQMPSAVGASLLLALLVVALLRSVWPRGHARPAP